MTAVLITGPTLEPLTPEQLKVRARHDRTDEDGLLPEFIRAARQQVEYDTERALLAQTWRTVVMGGGTIVLPRPPLQSVTTVTEWPADTARARVLDPSEYLVLLGLNAIALPTIDGDYEIDFVSGAASAAAVPPLLLQAVAILAVHYLTAGRDLVAARELAPVPQNYLDAVQPFRPVSV